ncbi:hypothetical protein DFQ01_14721 [Paenibacillus cellulosilyticus]|uniref:LiaF transmembrane domain-containing protein n=1 Tax=Paenibacillus cellulosilyticus TaxID=375489 RepID=A0A2V2YC21_9BACL|nr:hypothetical protein [Paenibacillus cellulosilyticus]PWV89370.1 hypothetical protein DFQ01_14721 [Paenibacillus cellulosilyticus]QKS47322.1 hypothetical protein HUB94_23135 [Paenibacillus cellulosilyticus]
MNNQSAKGIALIVVGALIALPILGITLGWIIKLLFPLILIGLGVVGWRNGSKVMGGLMIAFGGLMVLGKFHTWILLAIAIALVAFGVSHLNKRRY